MNPTATATDRQHHDEAFRDAAEIEIEQQENDEHRDRDHDLQPRLGALHVFELPAPAHVIAGRELDLLRDRLLGVGDEAPNVSTGDVHEDPGRSP